MQLDCFLDIAADSHFSLQNLPFGVFQPGHGGRPRVGTRIGDYVMDLNVIEEANFFKGQLQDQGVFATSSLNAFMALGRPAWLEARAVLQNLLRSDNPTLRDNRGLRARAIHAVDSVRLHLPVRIGDYTDFYSSLDHARNVGSLFRGEKNALPPNWLYLPAAYHGRASSIVLSGESIRRPRGQVLSPQGPPPRFGPTRALDFELEMGYFIGPGNPLGESIPIEQSFEHLFGMVLVNDWSARDIQRWEYQPLGPFLAKNFATSISPWVVTMDALEPFRCPGPQQDPAPLPYLRIAGNWHFDIHLEVRLRSQQMQSGDVICRTNSKNVYWNPCQQLAHHTISGCNLCTGDLLATGTISGPDAGTYGSLLELTRGGELPLHLSSGETRRFLADGDSVTLEGWCQGDGYRVGFGRVTNRILPEIA